MNQMTSKERFTCMYEHRVGDRVPIFDSPWGATIERWRREGMTEGMSYIDYFDLDHVAHVRVDNSPRFPPAVIEETEEYRIHTTSWGATLKNWKHV
ncbi:MAG: hypothetical protein HOH43_13755, partial [Candidatus Latescibacteria bacterium]|nr:hypothetical protein [Candidatus Latescibacterota bacterium]